MHYNACLEIITKGFRQNALTIYRSICPNYTSHRNFRQIGSYVVENIWRLGSVNRVSIAVCPRFFGSVKNVQQRESLFTSLITAYYDYSQRL